MRFSKLLTAGLALALLFGADAYAATDLNEVGAFLVYPVVIGVNGRETFITITNALDVPSTAHVSYIDGQQFLAGGNPNPRYCWECDFNIDLTGFDTEVLVLTTTPTGISIESEDGTVSHSCNQKFGMIVVSIERAGVTVSDNAYLGSEIVVDYPAGEAWSIPAIPFQGLSNNGDRVYNFNEVEYRAFPRFVAADFIAPELNNDISADLALFTLHFDRQHPPATDCSITGFDADEHDFSNSFLFGCWTFVKLVDIATEFAYPNLGQFPGDNHTHGWFLLNCSVDRDASGPLTSVLGGVHGALIQTVDTGQVIRRNDPTAPAPTGNIAWARLLYQSVTAGGNTSLSLGGVPGGLGGP